MTEQERQAHLRNVAAVLMAVELNAREKARAHFGARSQKSLDALEECGRVIKSVQDALRSVEALGLTAPVPLAEVSARLRRQG